jgi:hypothetical protein
LTVPLKDLYDYCAISPLFVYGPLPEDNVVAYFGYNALAGSTSAGLPGVPPIHRAAADGYYLILAPLPAGQHTIHFTGTFGRPFNFTLEITWNLTVAPGRPWGMAVSILRSTASGCGKASTTSGVVYQMAG